MSRKKRDRQRREKKLAAAAIKQLAQLKLVEQAGLIGPGGYRQIISEVQK